MSDNKNSLAHVGVLGMKWGVRRASGSSSKKPSNANKSTGTQKKKRLEDMSDDELRTAISRIQMEKQYKSLTAKETSAGKKFASEVLSSAGKQVATAYAAKLMTQKLDSMMSGKSKKAGAAVVSSVKSAKPSKPSKPTNVGTTLMLPYKKER